jgi:hypothetical protein
VPSIGIGGQVLGAVVLIGLAVIVSRRNLWISAVLCVLALAVLGWGYAEWAHMGR